MSSDSLNLSRFAGTSPNPKGSNPKSLQIANFDYKKERDGKKVQRNYLPGSGSIEVRRTGLAGHPLGGHGEARPAINRGKRERSRELRLWGGEQSGDGYRWTSLESCRRHLFSARDGVGWFPCDGSRILLKRTRLDIRRGESLGRIRITAPIG